MVGNALIGVIALGVIAFYCFLSITYIGPTQVGLVTKRFGRKLGDGHVIAFKKEAGYQADLLMPGYRFKPWFVFQVEKYPCVQVPADGIGVVIAQVGSYLPAGAKSAIYKEEFGNFHDVRSFVAGNGQQGVQRPVLPPGSLVPMHPVGFLVLTFSHVYGKPVSPDLLALANSRSGLTYTSFGLRPEELAVVRIEPDGGADFIGIVTVQEGNPLPSGDIAGRLGGFADILAMEAEGRSDAEVLEQLLASQNDKHNNYQNFQAFLDAGGKIGLQHDPLLYGAYLLNPFLVKVEKVPMLVVNQGQVAVIKSYLGLSTEDTSGTDFKFGSIVRPGHRGIWSEPLRTGKYPLNPRVYRAEIVATAILTLNWADATSHAHNLDAQLSSIEAKSREGFNFTIDLQVQIHVPDTMAPKVISMVETMLNLVNEVLQSAVGNYFRNTLQGLPAVEFIETRQLVQDKAERYITEYLGKYSVETKGVYIQDVVLPESLVEVLSSRELAVQRKQTFAREQESQSARIDVEKARGTADAQADLAKAQVNVEVQKNAAAARAAEAEGEAAYVRTTGTGEADKRRVIAFAEGDAAKAIGIGEAEAVKAKGLAQATAIEAQGLATAKAIEAQGLASAEAYEAQSAALGSSATALVAVANAVSEGQIKIVPDVLVTSGDGGGSGALEGLAATFMKNLSGGGTGNGGVKKVAAKLSAGSTKDDKPAPPPPPA